MDDDSGESTEEGDATGAETRESDLEKLGWGCRREAGSWFHRQGGRDIPDHLGASPNVIDAQTPLGRWPVMAGTPADSSRWPGMTFWQTTGSLCHHHACNNDTGSRVLVIRTRSPHMENRRLG